MAFGYGGAARRALRNRTSTNRTSSSSGSRSRSSGGSNNRSRILNSTPNVSTPSPEPPSVMRGPTSQPQWTEPAAPPTVDWDKGGLTNLRQGVGRGPSVVGTGGETPAPTMPGVSGVTPGAVERRLGNVPASLQAQELPQTPDLAARAFGRFNRGMVEHTPNLLGPSRLSVNSPVSVIEALMNQVRRQQG